MITNIDDVLKLPPPSRNTCRAIDIKSDQIGMYLVHCTSLHNLPKSGPGTAMY